jgi:repressor LexA
MLPMPTPLTERQNEIYEFIRRFMRTERKPPTLQEIGDAVGIRSVSGVHKQVRALETKGYIERTPNEARGLSLVAQDDPFALDDDGVPDLPVISRTTSDAPDTLRDKPQGLLSVDPYLMRGVRDLDACLIARAGDDGMNAAGLYKGDLLVVEEVPERAIRNGTLVAVLMGETLLARRFELANERVHFRPADRNYTEHTFPPEDPGYHVVGEIVSVLRRVR